MDTETNGTSSIQLAFPAHREETQHGHRDKWYVQHTAGIPCTQLKDMDTESNGLVSERS